MGAYGLTSKAPYSPFGAAAGGGGGGAYDLDTQTDAAVVDTGTWQVTGVGYTEVAYQVPNNPSTTQSVPTMTSNTSATPIEAFSDASTYGANPAYRVFDGSSADPGGLFATADASGYVGVDFGSGNDKVIDKFTITARTNASFLNNSPKDGSLQYSDDSTNGTDGTWTDAYTIPTQSAWSAGEERAWSFINTTAHRWWRFKCAGVISGTDLVFDELKLIEYTGPYADNYVRQEEGTDFTFSDPGGPGNRTLTFTNASGNTQQVKTEYVSEA